MYFNIKNYLKNNCTYATLQMHLHYTAKYSLNNYDQNYL